MASVLADVAGSMSARPTPAARLANPEALLSRTDLRELGLERRSVRRTSSAALTVIALPGYSRPLVRVADYLAHRCEASTYAGDRVR